MNIDQIKWRMKELRRLKKETIPYSKSRKRIAKQIKDLLKELDKCYEMTPKKKRLVDYIYAREPNLKKNGVDLRKFTEKQLENHIRKRGI